jgi:hypothetical protein
MKPKLKLKIVAAISLFACAAGLFATGSTGLMVAESEALAARINLWTLGCDGGPNTTGALYAAHEGKQTCARQKRDLVKELTGHAKSAERILEQILNNIDWDNSVDGINPDDGKVNGWKASYRLEARAARYYAKCIGRYDDVQCDDERAAIQKETARILALQGGYEEGWFIGTGLTRLKHSD